MIITKISNHKNLNTKSLDKISSEDLNSKLGLFLNAFLLPNKILILICRNRDTFTVDWLKHPTVLASFWLNHLFRSKISLVLFMGDTRTVIIASVLLMITYPVICWIIRAAKHATNRNMISFIFSVQLIKVDNYFSK